MDADATQDVPYVIGNGEEVVFLDDNAAELELARICYERCGAINLLVTFSEPVEFIEFLKTKKSKAAPAPAVLFLDINMPGMNGFEVLAWLKRDEYFKSLPVVLMLTNSANPGDQDRALQLGATRYFVKPTSPRAFVAILRSIRV